MSQPLTALSQLQANDGHRFGTVTVGFDKINTMRDEFLALRAVASAVCGIDEDALTQHDLNAFIAHRVDLKGLGQTELMSGVYASLERLIAATPTERRQCATDAVVWILTLGEAFSDSDLHV